jgi:hypothetical protein
VEEERRRITDHRHATEDRAFSAAIARTSTISVRTAIACGTPNVPCRKMKSPLTQVAMVKRI